MEVAIRKMGNSQGVLIPKPILAQVGLEGSADLQVRDGVIEIDDCAAGRTVEIAGGPLRGLMAVVERRLTARQAVGNGGAGAAHRRATDRADAVPVAFGKER